LCGIYSRDCAGAIGAAIGEGALEIARLLDTVRTRFLLEDEIRAFDRDGRSFLDIDTPGDFQRAKEAAGP
jgi:molybdopterin-guanine dinucleotide biosynthesis protein A